MAPKAKPVFYAGLILVLGMSWGLVMEWDEIRGDRAKDEAAAPSRVQASARPANSASVLKQIAVIDLPGPAGRRFDYLTIDPEDHWLLSAHLAAGLLYVIDMRSNKLVKSIGDVPGVEGVEYVAEGRKVYTSDWHENKIGVVSLAEMRVVKKLPTESKPDGSAYAAPFHKLYVSDELGRAEAVVDTVRDEIIKTLRFESETGMPRYDPVARLVYVNLQDQNLLAAIDPATDKVVGRWPVAGCKSNHGMALDAEHRRAFLSCEDNDRLTIFDLEKHAAIAHLPMEKGADVVDFDPGLRRIYVACSAGAISVFQQDDPDHYRKLQDFPVARRVHSLKVDAQTHRVYAPEEEENGLPVARMVVYEPSAPAAK